MTGPKHYREAERVRSVAMAPHLADQEGFSGWPRSELLALAQLHATLAATAAAAEPLAQSLGADPREIVLAWSRAIS